MGFKMNELPLRQSKEEKKNEKGFEVRATRETDQAEDVPQLQQSTHALA